MALAHADYLEAIVTGTCASVWDVIVVGAGPAGAVAALLLARRGQRVLLVDKSRFPREKTCGGCLGARGASLLRELGLEHVYADAPATTCVEIRHRLRQLRLELPTGYAISRATLDDRLVQAAIDAGAEFLPQTSARLLPGGDEQRSVCLAGPGDVSVAEARLILACDGLQGTLLEQESGCAWEIARDAWMGAAATVRDEQFHCDRGMVAMHVGSCGYVGAVRMDEQIVHFAAALDPAACKQQGGPINAMQHILEHSGAGRSAALENAHPRGAPLLTRQRSSYGSHRVLALGDACSYIEPFTGEGMTWAMKSAVMLMDLLPADLREWPADTPARWRRALKEAFAREQRLCRALRFVLHRKRLASSAMVVAGMMPAVAQVLAGSLAPGNIYREMDMTSLATNPRRSSTRQRAVTLLGLGTVTPARLPQPESADFAQPLCCDNQQQSLFLRRVYDHSGVDFRSSVLVDEQGDRYARSREFYRPRTSPDDRGPTTQARMKLYERYAPELAERAAQAALDDSGIDAQQITHLIPVSCTGFFAPGLDVELIRRLSLSPTIARVQVGFMGCHGAFNALAAGRRIIQADPSAVVLIVCVELCSLHLAYGFDPQKIVANALFSDGAAAAVLSGASSGQVGHARLISSSTMLIPDSLDAMSWRIGDYGFEMTLSPRLPDLIQSNIRPWADSWLGACGVPVDKLDAMAIHPGGPKVLAAVANGLGYPDEITAASRQILREFGNMSSGTVLFVLRRLLEEKATGRCLALGFGPGLTAEGLLLVLHR